MTASESAPLHETLRWLSAHTRFPASRLPAHAETLLLIATAAAEEEAEVNRQQRFLIKTRDPARDSALRAHNMRRSQVHYKCDNSAKV